MVDFFKNIYLFIWLHQVLIAACGIFSLHCSIQEFLVTACGIYFPDQGSNRGPLHYECRVLATGPPGKSQPDRFLNASLSSFHFYCFLYQDTHLKVPTGTRQAGQIKGATRLEGSKRNKNNRYRVRETLGTGKDYSKVENDRQRLKWTADIQDHLSAFRRADPIARSADCSDFYIGFPVSLF